MESSTAGTSGSGKTAGSRSKTPGIPASTRLQRNLAEKERRDKLNGFISELATLIPMVSNATKPLDKVSILRLAAAEMRLHFSCLNPKKYKMKPLVLPPAITSSLDLIERTTGGFIIVTTLTGLIVFCSRSIEDYLGYQNIDVMGNKIVKYIYEDDVKFFQSQVNSVVKSLKKAHKKTKVIKAHMLQKPLPRSSETCRPRNMIFKISVHQNDTSENGSSNGSSKLSSQAVKTRPQKDFGYSAVVLLFIEPVRFEPEIDITYIDSNQDVYFTRHGLQGEIIYADQRISTITGYMSHDVQGTSAYQYICSSDVPIALFAQKAMFTSPDGKGVIVYRLRIRDMRCIYLQSSGQIAYKESSNEISHFVCFNRLLSEEEGSQELKKFQQRYAPQIMAAKMLQVKQNPGSSSPTTDLAFNKVMNLINLSSISGASSTAVQTNSFVCSKISTPSACSDITGQKPSEIVVSPSLCPMESNLLHSSESHSTTSSIVNDPSCSITLNNPAYVNNDTIDVILEKPEQRLGGGPLRRTDCGSISSSNPYKSMANERKGKILAPEQSKNSLYHLDPSLVDEKTPHSVNNPNTNGTYRLHQNRQYISIKSQNRTVHFVNDNNNLFNGTDLNGIDEAHCSQSMSFDPTLPQKITFQIAAPTPNLNGQNNLMIDANEQLNEYLEEQIFKDASQILKPVEADPNILCDQLIYKEKQNPRSQIAHTEDTLSLSRMYDASAVSSLQKNSNISLHTDLYNGVDYCHNLNSYPQIDSYNNYHFPNSISNYINGANISAYNELDNIDSRVLSSSEMNEFHEIITSLGELKTISPMETFDTIKPSSENTAVNNVLGNTAPDDFMSTDISGIVNAKTLTIANQNSSVSPFLTNNGHELPASVDWNDILPDPTGSEDVSLNKELYNELESFFVNLPELNSSQTSTVKVISELPLDNSSYSQSSISSESKTNCHQ